ncbi:putative ABC transport system permease protein [Haloactinospora alba]|uniref:Putative ABC transport system permease protein n=1 Tax=Haloactinospora alba TaxID=405555 RepID=A0A543NEI4_9ACTN|nr:FtsX-like permease family protein [Haloactinospora alba]TQN30257.1 putative ABC transport system permease protein [Haloactinospora alba]
MLRTTLAGLRMHKARLVTTALAIALGVMFVTGTLVFGDTLEEGYSTKVLGAADEYAAVAIPAWDEGAPADPEAPAPVLPADTLEQIRDLPEVAAAGGMTRGDAPLLDKDGRAVGSVPTIGMSVGPDTRFQPAEGSLPEGSGEAALATTSADATGYGVGDTVTVLDSEDERHEFTVSGLIDFGVDRELSYRGVVAFDEDTTREMTGAEGYSEIDARAAEGVTDAEVVRAVEGVTGSDTHVETGAAYGDRLAAEAGGDTQVLTVGLMLFALISVLVAAIVIYNTFAILVAQRQREMALLRCVGSARGQVFLSVLTEALVVGLVASAVGVAVGVGAGWAGFAFGGEALGADASQPLVVGVLPVVVGMTVGTVMALGAALLPAWRATRVPPLAALRTSATAQGLEKGIGWVRITVGAVLFLISGGIVFAATDGDSTGPTGMVLTTVAGLVCFVGVVVLSPLLVRAVVAAVSPAMRRIGVASMLAADNSRRSPKRAATAMIALTVGATLITGYAVVSASLKTTMDERLAEQFPADYRISASLDDPDAVVPQSAVDALEESDAIGTVVERRRTSTESDDASGDLAVRSYIGATLGEDIKSDAVSGSLADMGPGKVAVSEEYAGGREAGDVLPLATEDGEQEYEIAAVLKDGGGMRGVTLAPQDFEKAFPDVDGAAGVLVDGAEDASAQQVRDAVYDAVADAPKVGVSSMAEMRAQFDDMLNIAFLAIAAMLGLAIIIAVFGIANTMALSVLERTRESAMLRALGLARGQLRRMLSIEAVVLCLIGAGVGILLGIVFGWAAGTTALESMVFTLPVAQIAVFIGVAVAAGLLASVLPGRKAAGASITGALASE